MNGCEGNIKYFPRGGKIFPEAEDSFCYTPTPYNSLQPNPQSGFYIKLPLAMHYANCACAHLFITFIGENYKAL